jgi:hypothetical protein
MLTLNKKGEFDMLMITTRNTAITTKEGIIKIERGKLARLTQTGKAQYLECTTTNGNVTKTRKYELIAPVDQVAFSKQFDSFNAVAQRKLEIIGNQLIEKGQMIELNVDGKDFKSIFKDFSMTEVNYIFESIPTKINI